MRVRTDDEPSRRAVRHRPAAPGPAPIPLTVALTAVALVLGGCTSGGEDSDSRAPSSAATSRAPSPSASAGSQTPSRGSSTGPSKRPSPPSGSATAKGRVVWSDEFDGAAGAAPDRRTWRYEAGGQGFGQGQEQCYTDSTDNAATDGRGHLVITARHAPGTRCRGGGTNDWTSAKLITGDRVTPKYGTVEMRAKLPAARGTWPAFWMLGTSRKQVGWPRCGEIDVVEGAGRRPTRAIGAIHGPTADSPSTPNSGGKQSKKGYGLGHAARADQPLSRAFHTYAVQWQPGKITWLLDGRPFFTATPKLAKARGGQWVYDQPFSLLLNLAVGGSIGGRPGKAMQATPQQFVVDYVRVYK